MALIHHPFRGGLVGLALVSLLLMLTGCKKTTEESTSSVIVNKTYWAREVLDAGFSIYLATKEDVDDDFARNDHAGFEVDEREQLEHNINAWKDLFGTNPPIEIRTTSNKDYEDLGSYYDYLPIQESEMGIYTSKNWFPSLGSSALAITQYFGSYKLRSTGAVWLEMTHADIVFNYRDFKFSIEDTGSRDPGVYDLVSISLHELGHFFGLQHLSDYDAVMYPSISSSGERRVLQPADKAAFKQIYEFATLGAMHQAVHKNNLQNLAHFAENEKNGQDEEYASIPEDGYEIGPWDDDDAVYRFVVELRADGTSVAHPPVKVIPQCLMRR